ncbi:ribose-5-phosphate isomerase RpiA [Pelistega europaea]|uniref:Ribose-5-phosphate isomerase A n=1 Tax=Pelistega europaea TaxID=106147 RepID=A0A7Y4L9Z8_9BURK|nr:ribose-5-phosphate isomerase RpiA [Pelistega europaea]NOL49659.1 ribose-5-phosphate isomerase RpiA [Pelistega europaea]
MAISQQELKQQVAQAAVEYILPLLQANDVVGVGTGSTADLFIDELAQYKHLFRAAAASSERSAQRLAKHGIQVLDLNDVESMPVYVDGADEINALRQMLKGGGGALTREKIVASVAERFVCIADESKVVDALGAFKLPIEVLPMAVASVSRAMSKLGGVAHIREGFITDNGNPIIDVAGFSVKDARELEQRINNIPGVVCCGFFALSPATVALIATQDGVKTL